MKYVNADSARFPKTPALFTISIDDAVIDVHVSDVQTISEFEIQIVVAYIVHGSPVTDSVVDFIQTHYETNMRAVCERFTVVCGTAICDVMQVPLDTHLYVFIAPYNG